MEGNIVRDFENLRVFARQNQIKMDELVQDLTNALEETATAGRACSSSMPEGAECNKILPKRYMKKRRGIRRSSSNNYFRKRGTISEASESSVDESMIDTLGGVIQSDSDDISSYRRIPKLTASMLDHVPLVESDSFTENLSPLRPQRRRRKFKSMTVDSSPLTEPIPSDSDSVSGNKQTLRKNEEIPHTSVDKQPYTDIKSPSSSSGTSSGVISGKRKRNSKSRAEYNTPPNSDILSTMTSLVPDRMEVANVSQESSLSSSEFDSDLNTNAEDAREADDEQSDFFHEPGPACGIPDIVPWWENERVTDKPLRIDSDFERILTGTFEHLPKLSNESFKARVGKLVSGTDREIRLGRRKLKGKMPRYTVGRFLQDRERWNCMQGQNPSFQIPGSSYNNNSNGHPCEFKRRRHVPKICNSEGASISGQSFPEQGTEIKTHRSSSKKTSPNVVMVSRRSARKSGHLKTTTSDS